MLSNSRHRLLLAVMVVVLCQLFLLRTVAVEADEGYFAACAARQISEHALPLTACVDTKPPGIFLLYEVAYRTFGLYEPAGLRLIWICVALCLALAVRKLCRCATAGNDAAAVTLLLLATSNYFLALKTELPALALAASGIAFATRKRSSGLFIAGLTIGLATLFKQPAAIFLCVAAVAGRPSGRWRLVEWARAGLLLIAGWILPLALTAVAYWSSGHLADLVEQVWVRPSLYAMRRSGGYSAWASLADTVKMLMPMICLVALFTISAVQRRSVRQLSTDWIVWAFLFAGIVFASLGGHFFPSYAIALISPLALLVTARGLPDRIREPGGLVSCAGIVLGIIIAGTVTAKLHDAAKTDIALAARINEAASPKDAIYAWGYAPELYPAVGRYPASSFIGSGLLFGYFQDSSVRLSPSAGMPYVLPGDWNRFLKELKARPFIFVDTSVIRMGARRNFAPDVFPKMKSFLGRHCLSLKPAGDFAMYRCL